MRKYNILFFMFILLFYKTVLFAQAEQAKPKNIEGELNFTYSHLFNSVKLNLGGFGNDFHTALSPVARFAQLDEIQAKQPLFNLGLEGVVLIPLYSNDHVKLFSSLGYGAKYSYEGYQIEYSPDNADTNGVKVGSFGGPGSKENITLHAMTNQFDIGIRIKHAKSLLYGNISLGVLFYSPLHLRWDRYALDADGLLVDKKTHHVSVGQSKIIDDGASGNTGSHRLSLRGTSETLATFSGRVGYGPFFLGATYATNIRVHTVSIDVGLTLHPFLRSNN